MNLVDAQAVFNLNPKFFMKSIVIINQTTGYLTVDVCNAFAEKYDKVILLAGSVSSYPRTCSPNVEVIHICKYNKSSIIKRLYTWLKGSLQIKNYLKKIDSSADVLYFTNPPMSYFWADKMDNRFGIVEYDIYPDALKNIKCPPTIIKWWEKRNIKVFDKADGIVTLSEGMKKLLTKYCPEDNIKVIYNWGQSNEVELVKDENNWFVKKHNLKDKFVVLYSGNIGFTHNVESIISVAEALRNNPIVVFLIIGQGGKKDSLLKTAKEKNLNNVKFLDYLPASDLKYSMSCANLGVVTLTRETANISVPSKTYNLLSYGIPLLNISTSDSEVGNIIKQNECGKSFDICDIDNIVRFIELCISNNTIYQNLRENAKKASRFFTSSNADKYIDIFK